MEVRDGEVYVEGSVLFRGDVDDALAAMLALVDGGGTHLVVTPNVDQVLRLERQPAFRRIFHQASLRIIDGMPLIWLARSLGAVGPLHRCTGADLLVAAARARHGRPLRICLVGGDPRVSRDASDALGRLSTDTVVRSIDMPMLESHDDAASLEVIGAIAQFGPDLTFLGLGSPKQELWYDFWRDRLPDGVYIGSGAAVDFAGGAKRRAPLFLQKAGLEWTWRLAQEPGRLAHRYLVDGPRFVPLAVRSHRSGREPGRAA